MKKSIFISIVLSFYFIQLLSAQKNVEEAVLKYASAFEWKIKPTYDDLMISEKNILSVNKKGKCGYMDIDENIIVPLKWRIATRVDVNGYGRVSKGVGSWVFYLDLNKNGEQIYDKKFNYAYDFIGDYAIVGSSGGPKYGVIDKSGEFVIPYGFGPFEVPANFNDIMKGNSEDMIPVKKFKHSGLGKAGFINRKEEWIIKPEYFRTYPRDGEYYRVEYTINKMGLINLKGDLVVPMEYMELKGVNETYIQAKKKSGWGLINNRGKEVIPFEYDFICNFDKDDKAYYEKGTKYGYIHAKDLKVEEKGSLDREPMKYIIGAMREGLDVYFSFDEKVLNRKSGIGLFENDKCNIKVESKYINIERARINDVWYFRVYLKEKGKTYVGLYNKKFELVIDPEKKEFNSLGSPNSSGYAVIGILGKYGVAKYKKLE